MVNAEVGSSGQAAEQASVDRDTGRQLVVQGNSARQQKRFAEAVDLYQLALKHIPNSAGLHNNMGIAYKGLGQLDDAIASYRRALEIDPDQFAAHSNLGFALEQSGRVLAAIASLRRALELNPSHVPTSFKLIRLQSQVCDWTPLDVSELGLAAESPFPPSALLHLDDAPDRQLVRARNFSHSAFPFSEPVPVRHTRARRLRVGYFSANFHNHPMMYLMARVFELHDRNRFHVTAYSIGPESDGEMRDRLLRGVESFHDIRNVNDQAAAELVRRNGIDVAVDLMGYTQDHRLQLFANRLAPVQISFLGYPGTTGADFLDYIIADPVLIPERLRRFYSEEILYLPDCYMPNDDRRAVSDRQFSRQELGLPEDGFVFCCFNNNKKIRPREFGIWMRLLGRIDDSVLWLFRSGKGTKANLRDEARKRGIDPRRLIFAEPLPLADHLARIRQADLFLDTFIWNAHTTASDALWVGLPVLTKLGESFAARVAGSLLQSMGLEELITHSEDEYEQLALELARNPSRLATVRQKLAANRDTSPVFDSRQYTRNIESAYMKSFERYVEGREPTTIFA